MVVGNAGAIPVFDTKPDHPGTSCVLLLLSHPQNTQKTLLASAVLMASSPENIT
jgi:hypothetical protein